MAFFEISIPMPFAFLISLKRLKSMQPVPVPMSNMWEFLYLIFLSIISHNNSVSGLGISVLLLT